MSTGNCEKTTTAVANLRYNFSCRSACVHECLLGILQDNKNKSLLAEFSANAVSREQQQ